MIESRTVNPTIERLRQELSTRVFDQGFHWRIMFLGKSVNGTTDIVSSLSRSLRNLGHHVFEVDTKRHERILHNPERVSGGMGPIYVRHEAISGMIDSFKPQIIITCAGGLVFTPEDAQAIKDRGILLVGVTLSDPDVFPTVVDHVHNFDVHTTNSETALQMYKDAGVQNTVYFPFGIDRGFVTQDVKPSPEFDADVICLGHANNRPDRNHVMTALDKRFNVRTYGRGWEIPKSRTVAGIEMVQALKGGRIHVNFPLTRAGFVNIKCGVFESAGQGGLVATGQFDEMAKFFEYGEEIVGYTDEEDLAEKIQELLDNPERAERIAENGFRRLITSHLYEHRWMDLFSTFRSFDAESFPWLDSSRREILNRTLSESLPRAKKVIVSGFYGTSKGGNLGDELILSSISSALQKADPAVQVTVASQVPGQVERMHGLQAYSRRNHQASEYHVHQAAAVVLGGGGLWHDYSFKASGGLMSFFTGSDISMAGFGILPIMARMLGRPFHVVGMGVGPLTDPDARGAVRFLAEQADSLYVRNTESADLLRSLPVDPERIITAPDAVYGIDLPSGRHRDQLPAEVVEALDAGYELVGLNLRTWAHHDMEPLFDRVLDALVEYSADRRVAVVALPMQIERHQDNVVLARLLERLPDTIRAVAFPGNLTRDSISAIYAELSVLLSMRLHAALLAHRLDLPVVGLAYDPKVTGHFAEVGRSRFCLPMDAPARDITAALREAATEGMPESTRAAVARLEEAAREALAVAARRIASTPGPEVVYEVPAAAAMSERPTAAPPAPTKPKPAGPRAGFRDMVADAQRLRLPEKEQIGRFRQTKDELHLHLPTAKPRKGMSIQWDGALRVSGRGPQEVHLTLDNDWSNAKAEGTVFLELQIGDRVLTHDLAADWDTVRVVAGVEGNTKVPVSLRMVVRKTAFRAASWPTASTVQLKVQGVTSSSGLAPGMVGASAGQVSDGTPAG
jgi:polysaccharide pyruvyl transferase WcaK-like protein